MRGGNRRPYVTNACTLTPPVLVTLFLRRHGWSHKKIALVTGRRYETICVHFETARRALGGLTPEQLDLLVLRGGELRKKLP